ncbi:MAG TPA: SseB family protein, partial [Brevibacterium sp.]|nr:SseB family protein [Brevibacterium sp.]
LAAVSDADSLLGLDAAAGDPVLLGRPAVWAIAQGRTWVPSWADPELPDIAARALRGITDVLGIRLERGSSTELRAVLALRANLDSTRVADVVARAQEALSRDEQVTDRVDSLELYPVAVAE